MLAGPLYILQPQLWTGPGGTKDLATGPVGLTAEPLLGQGQQIFQAGADPQDGCAGRRGADRDAPV